MYFIVYSGAWRGLAFKESDTKCRRRGGDVQIFVLLPLHWYGKHYCVMRTLVACDNRHDKATYLNQNLFIR